MRNVCFSDLYILDLYEDGDETNQNAINKFMEDVETWMDNKDLEIPAGWDFESFCVFFHLGLLHAIDLRDIKGMESFDQYTEGQELSELRNYIEAVTNGLNTYDQD